jgi:two-component system nitrate/nitrite response regulator NarP
MLKLHATYAEVMIVSAGISVAVCTDEPVWAEGIRAALRERPHLITFELFVAAQSSWISWLVSRECCNVTLLQWTPEITIDWLREARSACPEARIVLWSPWIPVELAYQSAHSGVHGVLRRGVTAADLLGCIEAVAANRTCFDQELMSQILQARTEPLTPRETQLVALLAHGLKNKEIATELNISEGTVKVYLSKLFVKLQVKDRFELALHGLKNQMPAGGSAAAGRSRLLLPRHKASSAAGDG